MPLASDNNERPSQKLRTLKNSNLFIEVNFICSVIYNLFRKSLFLFLLFILPSLGLCCPVRPYHSLLVKTVALSETNCRSFSVVEGRVS